MISRIQTISDVGLIFEDKLLGVTGESKNRDAIGYHILNLDCASDLNFGQ